MNISSGDPETFLSKICQTVHGSSTYVETPSLLENFEMPANKVLFAICISIILLMILAYISFVVLFFWCCVPRTISRHMMIAARVGLIVCTVGFEIFLGLCMFTKPQTLAAMIVMFNCHVLVWCLVIYYRSKLKVPGPQPHNFLQNLLFFTASVLLLTLATHSFPDALPEKCDSDFLVNFFAFVAYLNMTFCLCRRLRRFVRSEQLLIVVDAKITGEWTRNEGGQWARVIYEEPKPVEKPIQHKVYPVSHETQALFA
ncbi:unnamed protein product [Caenorhabditis sp. 36 PRJEB53466]|nr:unnamed protein product [Caenorhabditis sp. 36 PRJEB53466]